MTAMSVRREKMVLKAYNISSAAIDNEERKTSHSWAAGERLEEKTSGVGLGSAEKKIARA